ncbi:MAG TPA: universal stress protein [Chroococcales cyanobacterium]
MQILVAIDSSGASDEIVDAVGRAAWPDKAEFLLLTVVKPTADWENSQCYFHSCELILKQRTETLKKMLPEHKVLCEAMYGDPKKLIVETASLFKSALIIIGSHGDTGVGRASIGSVAAAVVETAPCNVEVVKVYKAKGAVQAAPQGKSKRHVPA